jgi:hypothetical protein
MFGIFLGLATCSSGLDSGAFNAVPEVDITSSEIDSLVVIVLLLDLSVADFSLDKFDFGVFCMTTYTPRFV